MEKPRQDPDQLLRAIQSETEKQPGGRLKIFFGYAAGVGKTYTMLEAAHQAKKRGVDVVAGYIEPHARPETTALLDGLERLPTCTVQQGTLTLQEFDLDAALRRRPQLVLVDELAHTNAEGSRHRKRYQDVQELLSAGIDVYTTVNVQHIESLNDTVASITGVFVRERIPDAVFDNADQVELVDIEPKELLDRFAGGKVYGAEQARRAAVNFFTMENLTALREIALRRCADRVNRLTESARIQRQGEYHTDEHILVCLSSSPSNAKLIRTAARMAMAFKGAFTALFVETPYFPHMLPADKERLRSNIHLAQQLGASIATTYGEDVPTQIAEYARLSGVSKIVIGRSTAARRGLFSKPTLTERLISAAPNLDIHVIPDAALEHSTGSRWRGTVPRPARVPVRDLGKTVLTLLAATLIGLAFDALGFTEANIVAVYIFGVLVVAMTTSNAFCGILASVVGVLVFNFFFTTPRLTFQFDDPEYLITFTIMFLVSLSTGSLASRLKETAVQTARTASRTRILFETNQLLQKQSEEHGAAEVAAGQILKLLERDVVVYLAGEKGLCEPEIYRCAYTRNEELTGENERAVASWVLHNNKQAGATTDTLSSAKCLYLAIRVNQTVYGVVGIALDGVPLDAFETSVLLSILGECALALESIRSNREKEQAAVLAQNEQLRANLLRAISHDLRTPLTSISGSASNLMTSYKELDDAARMQAFTDIYDDSMWLINLVENLLAVTRIEGGQVELNLSIELLDDVIAEAMRHIDRHSKEHTIRIDPGDGLLLIRADTRLVVQLLINLVDNAIKYTPVGSTIEIRTRKKGSWAEVTVADDGPGIPDEQKPRIFDLFYSASNRIVDSRRSLGLGLSLCKSIVSAHGGTISVVDNHPQGTVFTFTLPAGEVKLRE
ncbi:MAG: ATP-binding protein [Faecalibacterium sp.]